VTACVELGGEGGGKRGEGINGAGGKAHEPF